MNNKLTKKQKLIEALKKEVEKTRKFQEDFKKNVPDENNIKAGDLGYMNGAFEKMKLEHESILQLYYDYKKDN